MKVITKHISKEIIKFFILCQFIFILLYLVIEFIKKIDNFVEANVSLTLFITYLVCKTPTMIVQFITPAATMIAIIVVICQMKKNMEIMAMKACGLNLFTVLQPVLTVALIISLFSLFLSEIIVPYTSSRSNEIWEIDVNKRTQASIQKCIKSNNNFYYVKHFDAKTETMEHPSFYFLNDQFRLIKKISGDTCKWENGVWVIENAKIRTINKDNEDSIKIKSRYPLDIPETPDDFFKILKKPEDMNYVQLKKYAKKVKAEGYDNTADLVNLNMKLSFPFIGVVLAFIAIPIGLWEKTKGIPLAVTLGMLTIFLLIIVMGYAQAFGQAGKLPPFLSAWTANLLFSLLGINLFMNIKR